MRVFTSEDSFNIKGRGVAFIIPRDQMPKDLYDPTQLTGEIVNIDGIILKINGVETFAIARSPEHPYWFGFSLVGREVNDSAAA